MRVRQPKDFTLRFWQILRYTQSLRYLGALHSCFSLSSLPQGSVTHRAKRSTMAPVRGIPADILVRRAA